MRIDNGKELPKVYYGLHMVAGCAEYREPNAESFRIFVNEDTIKNMDASFQGRPVYVQHKDEVDIAKIREEADGLVVRSFYNSADGKHWAEFIVMSDKGHEAIRNGWRLSNAYLPKEYTNGGLWNGIQYDKEVKRGEYEHLAIVPNPRYDESIILTPDQFKEYNEKKLRDLKRLANSKGEKKVGLLNLFKQEKVENSADFDTMFVTLPKSKVKVSLVEAVEMADKLQNMSGYAADDHMVKLDDGEEMSVKDMRKNYCKKMNEEKEAEAKKNAELDGGERDAKKDWSKADKTENEEDEEEEEEDKKMMEKEGKKKNGKKSNAKEEENAHFEALKNARPEFRDPVRVDLDKTARGKARYGSGN